MNKRTFVSKVIGYLYYDVANISTMKYCMSVIPITTSGIPVDVKLKKKRSTETFQSEALKPFTDLTHIRQNINVAAEQIFVILIIDDCSPKAKLIDLVQIYNFKLTSAVCVRTKHTRKLTKVQNINIT